MILIGLGSNLTTAQYGSSKEILDAAISSLEGRGIKLITSSRFYETEPVPKSDQPWYVNAVICVETSLNARDLLKVLHDVEHGLGRTRRERWEARIIDLDLLCYHDEILPSEQEWADVAVDILPNGVVIPHGRLHERDFVLIPMADINEDWTHPVLGKTVRIMLQELESLGIVRLL